ncbi:ABC transporter permease [Niabella aurantiaca]|uniref:ABC transporter permease n=1 Tax=Niabella aurantiaca TaxID=379900 RepID=UPI00035CB997|nr:ABC transporter permease [Niabella aurantiaca]
MKFKDTLLLAFRTVKSNKLRTGLTVTIIAFGIMALVGIITAIKAMNQKFSESFSSMGANGFTIRFKERNMNMGGRGGDLAVSKKGKKEKQSNLNKVITREQAEYFINHYHFPGVVSGISVFGGRSNILSFSDKKTSPNVVLLGGDENYLSLNSYKILYGRNFTAGEIRGGQNLCILGLDVARSFFGEAMDGGINTTIRINNLPYRVLGILEGKGATFGFSRDNMVITGYQNWARNFGSPNVSYVIAVKVADLKQLDAAMGEAESFFRSVRRNGITEASNFALDRSDSAVQTAMNVLRYIRWAAIVIGVITLLGAAIGLMNIMLVSVSERTKEVGLVKALGGKRRSVKIQFLLEAIIISILGALLGILLGVIVGNLFSLVLHTGFVVPWDWVVYGIVICTIVGLGAGIYPAVKAGRLNPIEALRYE